MMHPWHRHFTQDKELELTSGQHPATSALEVNGALTVLNALDTAETNLSALLDSVLDSTLLLDLVRQKKPVPEKVITSNRIETWRRQGPEQRVAIATNCTETWVTITDSSSNVL